MTLLDELNADAWALMLFQFQRWPFNCGFMDRHGAIWLWESGPRPTVTDSAAWAVDALYGQQEMA